MGGEFRVENVRYQIFAPALIELQNRFRIIVISSYLRVLIAELHRRRAKLIRHRDYEQKWLVNGFKSPPDI